MKKLLLLVTMLLTLSLCRRYTGSRAGRDA